MDFVHDNLSDGRTIRILSLIDLWDRSRPMLTVGFSQTGQGVIRILSILAEQGRMQRALRADNGPEFTCDALKIWAEKKGITIKHTRPGKPTDNGHIESFNGRRGRNVSISAYLQRLPMPNRRLNNGGKTITRQGHMEH